MAAVIRWFSPKCPLGPLVGGMSFVLMLFVLFILCAPPLLKVFGWGVHLVVWYFRLWEPL